MRPERLLIAMLLLSGCATLPGPPARAPEPVPSSEAIQLAQLTSYSTALYSMVAGSVTEQAETLAAARAGYDQARQGPAALRYGLLLAAPLHAARDPVMAQQLLREALARPELLTPLERLLGNVELERVNAELKLGTENERLLAETRAERDRQRATPGNAALNRQLQTLTDQNAQLRRALDEARAKLDAIAEFERRQAERPPASEGRTP